MDEKEVIESRNGLSARGWDNVGAIMPKIKAAVKDRESTDNSFIDMNTTENHLMRPELIELCKKAINDDLIAQSFGYPKAFAGFPNVLEAFARFFNAYFKPCKPVKVSHLATAPGAASCLDTLFYNICDPGDGILMAGPYWTRSSVVGIPVVADNLQACMSESLIPALESAIEKAGRPVKALLVTNPNNPLGQSYSRSCIEAFIKFCHRHNIHYISDEVYALSAFSPPENQDLPGFESVLAIDVASMGCDPSLVHVVWSPSKDFGQNGTRMGCTITQANQEMAVGLALASNTTTSSLSAIFLSALLNSTGLSELVALNSTRLGAAYAALTEILRRHGIPYFPANAGFYIFARIAPKAETWEDEAAAVQKFRAGGILVSGGKGYHGPETEKGWARIAFALDESTFGEALKRIESILGEF